jgi:hypothetical protein
MKHHRLKIAPFFFEAVCKGIKTFEIRNNDRGYVAGDTATLCEIHYGDEFTGREVNIQINYVTDYMQKDGYVVFAFTRLPNN